MGHAYVGGTQSQRDTFELTSTTVVVPVKVSAAEIITVETTPVATKISAVVNARSDIGVRSYVTSRRPETVDPDAVRIIVAGPGYAGR